MYGLYCPRVIEYYTFIQKRYYRGIGCKGYRRTGSRPDRCKYVGIPYLQELPQG